MNITDERLKRLASLPDINGMITEEVQMARELLDLRQRYAELEQILLIPSYVIAGQFTVLQQERDAWREDANALAKDNERMANLMGGRDIDEWERINNHAALVEKYPLEKGDESM